MKKHPSPVGSSAADFPKENSCDCLTKKQLAHRLNFPSTRMVDELVRKRKIPVTRLGHRTLRFCWSDVVVALKAFQINAVR